MTVNQGCIENHDVRFGTIPILRQHIFGLFLTHPPTLRQRK